MNNDQVIHAYTRLDAIAEGMLIDATPMAREAGFRYRLKAICGPGDTAKPVLTILLPEED